MQRFIDLNWHTVPLAGTLERLADGSKTVPEFRKHWRTRYQEEFNREVTPLGGAITGRVSGIIAIDCDNTNTYKLFRSLDPDYGFVFVSKGKGYEAGTIIYKYTEALPENFKIKNEHFELDFYSNNGFIYLPTEANKTKEPFEMCELAEAPPAVVALLKQITPVKASVDVVAAKNINTANCLEPLVSKFVDSRTFMPGLFRIITPKMFREEPQYVSQGYLHPNNVPAGAGSDYLTRVSAILGKDPSIDEQLYVAAMLQINQLWDNPMPEQRLEKTILDPMITGSASINGEPIWFYDKNWKDYNLAIHTKRDNLLYLGYDDKRHQYYTVDPENEVVRSYDKDTELISHINAVAVNPIKKPELVRNVPLINVINLPNKDFGFIDGGEDNQVKTLNVFRQTPAMRVMQDPATYERHYKEPEYTLKFLRTLIPDNNSLTWLLGFIKRKLTRFEYSPVVLYFIGAHGSGKDTFVRILEQIMGRLTRPTVQEFLDKYNTYMMDTYFVQLDEYGDQLSTYKDREEARGKIKAYSGKQTIDIRQMRSDGFAYQHNVTFIMTANRNPLVLEEGDRRIAFFNTPNKLTDYFGDVPALMDKINSELLDFAYYLATEVKELSRGDYSRPLESRERHRLIAESMPAGPKLQYILKHQLYDYLTELAEDYNISSVTEELLSPYLSSDSLEDLYMEMTDGRGDVRNLHKQLRTAGLNPRRTTKDGRQVLQYPIDLKEGTL